MVEIEIDNTHLYKGARGRIVSGGAGPGVTPVLVHFADGVSGEGRLLGDRLEVSAHVTRAGTSIAAKAWRLEVDGTDLLIRGRLPD